MGFFTRTFLPRSVQRAMNPVGTAKAEARRCIVPEPIRKAQHYKNAAQNPTDYVKRRATNKLSNAIRNKIFK